MDKSQAIYSFWCNFGLPVYDENTVPDNAVMPYITYSMNTGAIGEVVNLTASVWYKSNSWAAISQKVDEISDFITIGGKVLHIDTGLIWIVRSIPFSQRMGVEEDDTVRRIVLNVQAEFLTEN